MIATSQPLATEAGLRAFERGGNAVDAALTAAAVLCVTEPMSTGRRRRRVRARLVATASWSGSTRPGRAGGGRPRRAGGRARPESVTVPGAVAGWAGAEPSGSDASASTRASRTRSTSPRAATRCRRSRPRPGTTRRTQCELGPGVVPPELKPAPQAGDQVRLPELAATLRRLADEGAASALSRRARGAHLRRLVARGERPRRATRRPGRAAARCATAATRSPSCRRRRRASPRWRRSRCSRGSSRRSSTRRAALQLALEDAYARVRDGADVSDLLTPDVDRAPRARRSPRPRRSRRAARSTSARWTATARRSRSSRACSATSAPGSWRRGRGSCCRTAAPASRSPATSSRGAGRTTRSSPACCCATAARRPVRGHGRLHPGPGAHAARLRRSSTDGLDPQAALDEPRFRVAGRRRLPRGGPLGPRRRARAARATPSCSTATRSASAAGRRSCARRTALVGGSDRRKDGYAAGL